MKPRDIHILNLGAGVQSTTLYLMFFYGEIPVTLDAAIFADTGEEPKAVYKHLRWLQSLGGPKIIVRSAGSLGENLKRGKLTKSGTRFASIPAFTIMPGASDTGQTRRQCSKEFKVEVIERAIRRDICGLAPKKRIPKKDFAIHQYVGISLDEAGRFTRLKRQRKLGTMHAPLIERHMKRSDCVTWLEERGRVPHEVPRSACVFCPFHDDAEWEKVKSVPEDWTRAVEIDEALRAGGSVTNRDMDSEMFVHRKCQPLVQIDLKARTPKLQGQDTFGFWRTDAFSRECLGVCGL